MSKDTGDRAESIRRRIRNHLRQQGEDVQFGLQRYAIERLLYGLGVSPHRERFVLKGAVLSALWGGSAYRPTRDVDFTGYGSSDPEDVLRAFRDILEHSNQPDVLMFHGDTLSAEEIRDDSEYHGLRIKCEATLGSSRIPVQIDIGFGNAIEPAPQDIEYPTLLDDPPPQVRAYPMEAVVAEKLHAMAMLGERNSRFKDFYDLFVMASRFSFDGARLARAVSATFERRRTSIDAALPVALTPRFYADASRAANWRAYLSRNAIPGAPVDFAQVGEMLLAFLVPLWSQLSADDSFSLVWPSGGPWRNVE